MDLLSTKSTEFFRGRSVAVTGGNGFVGSYLVERLVSLGAIVRAIGRSTNISNLASVKGQVEYRQADLTRPEECAKAISGVDFVFHLASKVGGIQYNLAHPAEMFSLNLTMSLNVLEACSKAKSVERVLYVSSTCVYRRFCTIPSPEVEGFIEDPEPTNIGYGWAKRAGEKAAEMYAKEFGLKVGIVRPENIYGPRDNFAIEYAHVIPALLRRAVEAKDSFVIWGSGKQTRSFLHARDAATAMTIALEKHAEPDPINLGSNQETTIADLAKMILKSLGKDGVKLVFDMQKPEGQPRKAADTAKMKAVRGFTPDTTLAKGIDETVRWVLANPECLN